jgi:oxygen-independent coproporphyrinogen III oxidase
MAGLYIHIPFCRQACYYCDFHFSTNQSYRAELIDCLSVEIRLQQGYLNGERLTTIYLGGGTPSLLSESEMHLLMDSVYRHFEVAASPEITLEANPDDLTWERVGGLKSMGVNRISLGVQSFDDNILKFLHRAHTAHDALQCIDRLRKVGFQNISIDLIHSIPGQDDDQLKKNLKQALAFEPEHLSAYSLTIEPETVFGKWHAKGQLEAVDEPAAARQFEIVMDTLVDNGYRHYEISNFCKPGFASVHNSNYWKQETYLGIGPSAHSYNKVSRQFNIHNNHLYMKSIRDGIVPFTVEMLTRANQINEYIFTSLRTDEGCHLPYLVNNFSYDLMEAQTPYLHQLQEKKMITLAGNIITLTRSGKLLADRIASDLFISPD